MSYGFQALIGWWKRSSELPLPSAPWTEIALDFSEPFISDDYVLVAIDEYILFHEVEIITSTSTKVVISNLNSIIARQGLPTVDNGPRFQSRIHGLCHPVRFSS